MRYFRPRAFKGFVKVLRRRASAGLESGAPQAFLSMHDPCDWVCTGYSC